MKRDTNAEPGKALVAIGPRCGTLNDSAFNRRSATNAASSHFAGLIREQVGLDGLGGIERAVKQSAPAREEEEAPPARASRPREEAPAQHPGGLHRRPAPRDA